MNPKITTTKRVFFLFVVIMFFSLFFYLFFFLWLTGKLPKRDDPKVIGTDKEKSLFEASTEFYPNVAKKCLSERVSVE
jgi:hypothetical protein